MENWVMCQVSAGQLGNEFGVDGQQFNGTVFSLFAPADTVDFTQPPTKGKAVAGWIKVEVLDRKGDVVLVRLPRQTFQNGPFISVKVSQLREPLRPEKIVKPRKTAQ